MNMAGMATLSRLAAHPSPSRGEGLGKKGQQIDHSESE